jgi:hypothetical protein
MVVIRPTGDLAKRMKVKLIARDEQSSTLLGDWYALDLVLAQRQYVLCVSENGRLPMLLNAAPYSTFPERLPNALADVLPRLGIPSDKIKDEVFRMADSVLAKTANRSVLGSMNEFRYALRARSQDRRFDNDQVLLSLWLAERISLILPDLTPKDTVLKVFGEPIQARGRRPHLSLVSNNE